MDYAKNKVIETRNEEIRRLYQKGQGGKLAQQFRISRQRVHQIVRRANIYRPSKAAHNQCLGELWLKVKDFILWLIIGRV